MDAVKNIIHFKNFMHRHNVRTTSYSIINSTTGKYFSTVNHLNDDTEISTDSKVGTNLKSIINSITGKQCSAAFYSITLIAVNKTNSDLYNS